MTPLKESALSEFCSQTGISPTSRQEIALVVRRIGAKAIRAALTAIENSEEYEDGASVEDLIHRVAVFIDA